MTTTLLAPPRDDLIRAVLTPDLASFRAEDDDPSVGTLFGHAAVFGEWTEINSWEGHFLERLAPGAFRKTLKERGDSVKILFNHGMDPTVGDKPLGRASILREDRTGLYVEVPLDDTSYNRDLAASLRSGALDGMSFRFSVTREDIDKTPQESYHNPRGLPERTITEVKLYELGPVTFPAYEATTAGIRSREAFALWRATPPAERLRIFKESGLTDAAPTGTSAEPNDAPPLGTRRRSKALANARLLVMRDVSL